MFHADLEDGCGLRLLAADDARELSALIDRERARLVPWMPWAAASTLQATEEFVAGATERAARGDGFQAVIVCGGAIAGVAGFHRVDREHRATSIGYWLAGACEGRGLMTRAVRALVDHALGPWELHRVEIRCAAGNARSRAIPQRLGFREEGVLREAELVGGRYLDHVVYGLLAHEWTSRPA